MGYLILLLLFPVIACAQLRSASITFEGIGCASCMESLPARVQRMRGVESAKVDPAQSLLIVSLAEENRVRLEQLRDAIQQDGTKARKAEVTARGQLEELSGGTWVFRLPAPAAPWAVSLEDVPPSIQYSLKAGAATITGVVAPLDGDMKITPTRIAAAGDGR